MSAITHSPEQSKALLDIKDWWNNGSPATPEYLLFGYAGTGKTTIIKELPNLLDLFVFEDPPEVDGKKGEVPEGRYVLYCAFTGKAASVLRRKGINAFTIHQSIYGRPIINEDLLTQLTSAIKSLPAGHHELFSKQRELKRLLSPSFSLKEADSRASNCMLIVVDECSMIDERLYKDLVQLGIPIIFTGDPAQLPPVGKSAGLIERVPNTVLTQIHRQAKDNPILQIATHLRESHILPKIAVPEIVITNVEPPIGQIAEFGQTICGYHTTRRRLNNNLRKFWGFDELPQGKGEKIINLKNDHTLGIMNGEMMTLVDVVHDDHNMFFKGTPADLDTQAVLGGHFAHSQLIYNGHFFDAVQYVNGRADMDWRERAEATELDWGYAITCHKSQGSEWDTVFVKDDGFGRSAEDRRRWLYTAITRARNQVYVSSGSAV